MKGTIPYLFTVSYSLSAPLFTGFVGVIDSSSIHFPCVFFAAAALISTSYAFKFNIDSTVAAGQNTTVTAVLDANDATAENFTIVLYTATEYTPICITPISSMHRRTARLKILQGILIDSVPVSATTFSIFIPPSVGPPGAYYRLAILSFDNTSFILFLASTYTSPFFLANTAGVLSIRNTL